MDHWKIHSYLFCLGKYYYEVACHDQGLCRVGWSTSQALLDLGKFMLFQFDFLTDLVMMFFYPVLFSGTDKYGFGFGGTGKKSYNKQFDSYGEVRRDESFGSDAVSALRSGRCYLSFVFSRSSLCMMSSVVT